MTSEIEAQIEKQWGRYPKSIFIDLQILGYAGLFSVLAFRFDPDFTTFAGIAGFACILVAYLTANIRSMFVGRRLDFHLPFLKRIRFRFVPGGNFRVTSVFSVPTIITPHEVVAMNEPIVHEIGHIRSGDHRFYVIVKPLMLLCLIVMFAALVLEIISTPWCYSCVDEDMRLIIIAFIVQQFFVYLALIALVIGALFLTVREREYLADRFALDVMGQTFQDYLEFEALLKRRPRSRLVGLWNKFTHPSYDQRCRKLNRGRYSLSEASLLSGILAVANFYFLDHSMRLSLGSILDEDTNMFEPNLESLIWIAAFGFLLFIGVSALMYLSSVLAFTVSRNTFADVTKKVAWMMFGVLCVMALIEIQVPDLLDPLSREWLVDRMLGGMSTIALYVGIVLGLCYVGKRRLGTVKDFGVWSHFSIAVCVSVGLAWTGLIG